MEEQVFNQPIIEADLAYKHNVRKMLISVIQPRRDGMGEQCSINQSQTSNTININNHADCPTSRPSQ